MKESFGVLSTDWKEGINWPAVRQWRHGLGAGRVAVLGVALDAELGAELSSAVELLGGHRAGRAAGSHLAEVARSLGVPMVIGCRAETVTGPSPAPGAWVATIDGGTGEVALAPA